MRITKAESEDPTSELIEQAATQSSHEFTIRGDKLVLRVCPFCKNDDGPRYASAARASWFLGAPSPGGFSCKKCGQVFGPYQMFKAMGVEIGRDALPSPLTASSDPGVVAPQAKIVRRSSVAKEHLRSVALLFEDQGAPVLSYLQSRGLLSDPPDYMTQPPHLQTIGAWRYPDGALGVAWWYFDVATRKPLMAKYRVADPRAKGQMRRVARWPAGVESVPCYREHLYDPSLGEVLITEGEADAESWALLRIPNVVSLPDGAGSAEAAYQLLASATSVYESVDNDHAGSEAARKIESLIREDATVYRIVLSRESGGSYKDANEALSSEGEAGEEYLYAAYSQARVTGEPVLSFRRPYISTGFPSFDGKYFGLRRGAFSHIYGGAGQGKSTWAWSLLLRVHAKGVKCAYVSLEEPCDDISTDMAGSMAGISRGDMIRLCAASSPDLEKWIRKVDSLQKQLVKGVRFYGCGQEWPDHTVPSYERMLDAVKLSCRTGARVVVIDNYSVLRNALTAPTPGEGKAQFLTDYAAASRIAQDVLSTAKAHGTHIVLLNHVSGAGSAYGMSRIEPLAELSFLCERRGTYTNLKPTKSRVCDGLPQGIRFAMSGGGALLDAGLISPRRSAEIGDEADRRGGSRDM